MLIKAIQVVYAYFDGTPDKDNVVGQYRNNVLPTADADEVWALCDAIRSVTKYPEHVPNFRTHNVEDARDWCDGWLA